MILSFAYGKGMPKLLILIEKQCHGSA